MLTMPRTTNVSEDDAPGRRADFSANFVAGTLAGSSQLLIGHPFDTIKVKMQSSNSGIGVLALTSQTFSKEGFPGLYRGMGPPLAAVAAFNAVLFATRGAVNRQLARSDGSAQTVMDGLISSSAAGCTASLIATPTELIKCRLQHQGTYATALKTHAAWAQSGRKGLEPTQYRGILDVATSIWTKERGVIGLYNGLTCTLAREIPGNIAMFGAYELASAEIAKAQGLSGASELNNMSRMAAGGIGGVMFWAAAFPFDMIKSRIQVQRYEAPSYTGIIDCARQVYTKEGVHGFTRGLSPCMMRAFPANAAAFVTFELYMDFASQS